MPTRLLLRLARSAERSTTPPCFDRLAFLGDFGGDATLPRRAGRVVTGASRMASTLKSVCEALALLTLRPQSLNAVVSIEKTKSVASAMRQTRDARVGNRLIRFFGWASDSETDGHLTHPETKAGRSPGPVQIVGAWPTVKHLTLDQGVPGSNPGAPAILLPLLPWGLMSWPLAGASARTAGLTMHGGRREGWPAGPPSVPRERPGSAGSPRASDGTRSGRVSPASRRAVRHGT